MSRGLGATQRLVLLVLEEDDREPGWRWMSAYEIAHRRVCGGTLWWDGDDFRGEWACERCGAELHASAADIETVRRAIRSLARAGRIETEHYRQPTDHRKVTYWGTITRNAARKMLMARLPLSVEERESEAARQRLFEQSLRKLVEGRSP